MKHLYLLMNYWKCEWKLISSAWLFEAIYTVHGILQARILEWIAFPFSRGSSQPRDRTQVSHITGGFFYQLSYQGSPDELLYDSKKWQMNARLQSTPALTFIYTSRWRTPWPWSHSGVNNLPFLGKWSWTEIWTIGSVKNNPASLQLVKHHYAKTSE